MRPGLRRFGAFAQQEFRQSEPGRHQGKGQGATEQEQVSSSIPYYTI